METTQIRLARRPEGEPDDTTFTTTTETLPELQDGQVALAIRYLSLDPYMRGRLSTAKSYADPVGIGQVEGQREEATEGIVAVRPERAAGDEAPAAI